MERGAGRNTSSTTSQKGATAQSRSICAAMGTARRHRHHGAADYVADICSVADMLPTPPIVIGHSLGGLIVQKYLEVRDAPAAVLLASAPVSGIAGTWLRSFKRHPLLIARVFITGTSLHDVNTPERARQAFYSPNTPEVVVARAVPKLTAERLRAAVFDMIWR